MKTSTQPERRGSVWTSRRFDQRVEFDAGELVRQPDFAPPREPRESGGYARHFYGDRAAPPPRWSPRRGKRTAASPPTDPRPPCWP